MKAKRLFITTLGCVSIIFIINACSKSTSSKPPQVAGGATIVNIANMAFPAPATIKVGDSITWVNKDGYAHTVTSDDATSFSSGQIAAQGSFTFKATVAGTFAYHCNIHADMHGTLIVTQ